jgi:D-alanine-D-alanine ligase
MRIGITYDLKADQPANGRALSPLVPLPGGERGWGEGAPDDLQEEFDSPATIEAIAAVLRGLGHDVEKLGDGRGLLERLLADPPDFVFNFAEGQGVGRSREARVPAVLEMLGIPYSGSDPLTLAVTLDKHCAKQLIGTTARQRVPAGVLIGADDDPLARPALEDFPFPGILKPAWEGSSKGIRGTCLVDRLEDLPPLVESMRRGYGQPLLLEEFIEGEELTVGVIGNGRPEILGVMRVSPVQPTERFIYSLEVKRDYLRQVRYECPARLPPGELEQVKAAAVEAFRALGCRDVARIDYRLGSGRLYFLEANPLPGLNPESSDLVIMARLCGWTYEQLIGQIVQAALERNAAAAATARESLDPVG